MTMLETNDDHRAIAGVDDATIAPSVLVVMAHPDDEAFGLAGTMAELIDRGVHVTLVTATRGEVGQILVPDLADPVTLGAVRELELRSAMAELGVTDIHLLGYRDSGMDGTPENVDPRSLAQAPDAEVIALIVAHIRHLRTAALVTFGPDGIYGHPDHVKVHHVTRAAVEAAADPSLPAGLGAPWRVGALYYNAIPKERIAQMAQREDGPFRGIPPEIRDQFGTPLADIDTILDVAHRLSLKERALYRHQTQIGEDGPMAGLPREDVRRMMSSEYLRRVSLPWDDAGDLVDDPISALPRAEPPKELLAMERSRSA